MNILQVLQKYTAGEATAQSMLRTQRVLLHIAERDMSIIEYSEAVGMSMPQASSDLKKAHNGKYVVPYLSKEKATNNKFPKIYTITPEGKALVSDLIKPFAKGGEE